MSQQPNKMLLKIITESLEKKLSEEGLDSVVIANTLRSAATEFIIKNRDIFNEAIMEMAVEKLSIPQKITIPKYDEKEMGDVVVHKQFDDLVKSISTKIPVLLVGMPGTGKTSAAEHVATAMKLKFYSISVGIQTTKSDILGFIDAGGKYKATSFRKAFEKGGLFLMDEVDAGNPNVLIVINSAISNGFCNFPDKMVEAHPDFRFIATANTYGTGADTKFIGRNQLDEATLDRFITIEWEIDEVLERIITGNDQWLNKIKSLRDRVKNSNYNFLVSPRVSIYGSRLIEAGFTMKQAAEMTILKGKDADSKNFINGALNL